MKNIFLIGFLSLFLCSCATYVLPDGEVVSVSPAPRVTPYYTGYLNPWGYGTSGSYGGGYYPVYSGAWNNYNGWNNCNKAWSGYGYCGKK